MRFPIRKKPVKEEDLLTAEEMASVAKIEHWPIDKAVLWMCGVRKPWSDNEYPPFGPPGKPTYAKVLAHVMKAAKNGEFEFKK